jgi:hypothetical protein
MICRMLRLPCTEASTGVIDTFTAPTRGSKFCARAVRATEAQKTAMHDLKEALSIRIFDELSSTIRFESY